VVATEVSVLVVLLVLVTFVWVVLKVQLRFVCVCYVVRGVHLKVVRLVRFVGSGRLKNRL
jgi:hypothetical protein